MGLTMGFYNEVDRWEIQPPIHADTIRPEPILVKHYFVLSPTNF